MLFRKRNVTELKKLMEQRKEFQKHFVSLERFLIAKGISKSIVDEIILSLKQEDDLDKRLLTLKEALASKIKASAGFDFSLNLPKIVALVGGAGIGKTTTLLKLALAHSKSKRVGILALDKDEEVIEKLAKGWGIAFEAGIDKLSSLKGCELILLDIPGCSYYESRKVQDLEALFAKFEEVEIHLTLSATTKEVDIYGALHQFSVFDIKSLIFTKLDETLTPGVVVNVSSKVDFPISYIAYDYPLPGKIELATPELITHKILTDLNGEMFHFLRQMAFH